MVDYQGTLHRLNREKEYEDEISMTLCGFFISCLNDIENLSEEEKKELNAKLSRIMKDSHRHSGMFAKMIEMVVERGKDNY